MSFLGRVHSALALLMVSHSPVFSMVPGWSFSPSFHSSFSMRMGRLMWSEYLPMTCLIFQALRNSSASGRRDRKSTRLNSSHLVISYAVFCLKKKKRRLVILLHACAGDVVIGNGRVLSETVT